MKKNEVTCDRVAAQQALLQCDDSCLQKKKEIDLLEQEKLRSIQELEQEKNRKELEEFEKKFGKKKNKVRNRYADDEEQSGPKVLVLVSASIAVILLGLAIFYYFN